jgi:hypothetical protein
LYRKAFPVSRFSAAQARFRLAAGTEALTTEDTGDAEEKTTGHGFARICTNQNLIHLNLTDGINNGHPLLDGR